MCDIHSKGKGGRHVGVVYCILRISSKHKSCTRVLQSCAQSTDGGGNEGMIDQCKKASE